LKGKKMTALQQAKQLARSIHPPDPKTETAQTKRWGLKMMQRIHPDKAWAIWDALNKNGLLANYNSFDANTSDPRAEAMARRLIRQVTNLAEYDYDSSFRPFPSNTANEAVIKKADDSNKKLDEARTRLSAARLAVESASDPQAARAQVTVAESALTIAQQAADSAARDLAQEEERVRIANQPSEDKYERMRQRASVIFSSFTHAKELLFDHTNIPQWDSKSLQGWMDYLGILPGELEGVPEPQLPIPPQAPPPQREEPEPFERSREVPPAPGRNSEGKYTRTGWNFGDDFFDLPDDFPRAPRAPPPPQPFPGQGQRTRDKPRPRRQPPPNLNTPVLTPEENEKIRLTNIKNATYTKYYEDKKKYNVPGHVTAEYEVDETELDFSKDPVKPDDSVFYLSDDHAEWLHKQIQKWRDREGVFESRPKVHIGYPVAALMIGKGLEDPIHQYYADASEARYTSPDPITTMMSHWMIKIMQEQDPEEKGIYAGASHQFYHHDLYTIMKRIVLQLGPEMVSARHLRETILHTEATLNRSTRKWSETFDFFKVKLAYNPQNQQALDEFLEQFEADYTVKITGEEIQGATRALVRRPSESKTAELALMYETMLHWDEKEAWNWSWNEKFDDGAHTWRRRRGGPPSVQKYIEDLIDPLYMKLFQRDTSITSKQYITLFRPLLLAVYNADMRARDTYYKLLLTLFLNRIWKYRGLKTYERLKQDYTLYVRITPRQSDAVESAIEQWIARSVSNDPTVTVEEMESEATRMPEVSVNPQAPMQTENRPLIQGNKQQLFFFFCFRRALFILFLVTRLIFSFLQSHSRRLWIPMN
jgi:hypothetical protein